MLLQACAGTVGGNYGLMGPIRQGSNVSDLTTLEQREAVNNVKMFSSKKEQSFYGVQTLYSGTTEHVDHLKGHTVGLTVEAGKIRCCICKKAIKKMDQIRQTNKIFVS